MSRTFLAGLGIVDIDRIDADKDRARLDQVRRSVAGQVGRTCGVRGRSEMAIPAGVQQHGLALKLAVVEDLRRNPALFRVGQPKQLDGQIDQRLQVEVSEIGPRRVTVVGTIQIGAGVAGQA